MNSNLNELAEFNSNEIAQQLQSSFALQRNNFLNSAEESYKERKQHLNNLKKMIEDLNKKSMVLSPE